MASVNDCLVQMQQLTRKNFEILKTINDSFFTKKNHLTVNIDETSYVIPSFVSLENKVNALQATLESIVNAPTTGEAYFNFDGDSRAIEVRGYTHTPNSLSLSPVDKYGVEQNDIFKDFLTPVPYIHIPLDSIPNDITSVNIRKVIPRNTELVSDFSTMIGDVASRQLQWGDLYKKLAIYKEDDDYIMHDTTRKLPIRKNIGKGTYVIEKIIGDVVDENLNNFITIKFKSNVDENLYCNKLTYKKFDETIEIPLKVGDQLVTFDDSAKMEITEIRSSSNTVTVRVLYGEYLNLVENIGGEISDLSKLKFFSPIDFNEDKYINIPLEEDQYVFIAVAPLNDRMNIQSPWGTGLVLNTYKLTNDSDLGFQEYYYKNVKNLGDVLYELTSMFSGTTSKLSIDSYNSLINKKPVINPETIKVSHINKHLNDSVSVKNIRALYSQKKKYNTELIEIQEKISITNSKLAEISFDDTNNMRSVYVAELTEYNKKKNELVASITKIIDEISLSANNSEVPIENAKYRIRGYYPLDNDNIIGIEVQYRYKNLDTPQSTAESFNGEFLFSDWNTMPKSYRKKLSKLEGSSIKYVLQTDNSKENEPSFNQIDIPISQGETVDIRLKVIYDYGYPFVETASDWSEIYNVAFPEEYLKDVQILDIISENNNDIETNRFQNMLNDAGIPDHIGDKITDQDITYFHKPENIASGFYTAERRIIPLKDKLTELSSMITVLQDEMLGTSSTSLEVSIVNGDVSNKLLPYQINQISVESYNSIAQYSGGSGTYIIDDNKVVSTVLNISLSNTSQHSVKLFAMFPGNIDSRINSIQHSKFTKEDYCKGTNCGVWVNYFKNPGTENGTESSNESDDKGLKLQSPNQFLTFRLNNCYNGEEYYGSASELNSPSDIFTSDLLSYEEGSVKLSGKFGAAMYPTLRESYELTIQNSESMPYIVLAPGEELIVPVIFEYKLSDVTKSISKTMSFDIRTSLYSDPINYTFRVTAKLENTTQDKLINTNRKYINTSKYHTTVVK